MIKDIKPTDIMLKVPNGDRVKVFNKNTEKYEYLTKTILKTFTLNNIRC